MQLASLETTVNSDKHSCQGYAQALVNVLYRAMKLVDILHSGSAHILSSTSEHLMTRVSAFSDSP